MAVQKVQILRLRYLGHLCRQGQRIGRMVEEGIGGDFHLVKMDARARFYKTHRRGVADEMNLVSALRQFLPQLGGYYAAAAVRGIASNSYFHAPPIPEARLDDLVRQVAYVSPDSTPGGILHAFCGHIKRQESSVKSFARLPCRLFVNASLPA